MGLAPASVLGYAQSLMKPIENTTGQDPRRHDQAIREMFGGIARVYDRMNGILSLGRDAAWRRDLAREIDPSARDLLDVCCGTGELILTAIDQGKGQRHVAADFCLPMLQAGVRDHDLARRCQVVAADTQRLPLPEASFDAVMVGFGLRNLGQLERGLRELARVLRPGGQLLVLEFFRPSRSWFSAPVRWYLDRVVPVLGRMFGRAPTAYTYLPRSMGRFVTPGEFVEVLRRSGFAGEVLVRRQTLGIAHLVVARRSELPGRSGGPRISPEPTI